MFLRFIPVIARISSSISVNCQTINTTWLYLSIHKLMEVWVVSALLLSVMLLWTLVYTFLDGPVFISLRWDFILRVSWLISPFLGLCSDCPFCLHSFFSSWVVLRLFRPGAQSLLLQSFPDYPALMEPFLFSPVM